MKTRTKSFLTKIFRGNFDEVAQQSWPSRKMSLIALKYNFPAQQSILHNKNWDEIIFDK